MTIEMLDVVDENDNVVGIASRTDVHAQGLWHREIGILFVTPQREFIFQKRSMQKTTNPGLLAFTVAGHVVAGDSYEEAVRKEAEEETGLHLNVSDLVLIKKDKTDNPSNLCHRLLYGYVFDQPLDTLQIEEGEADGFVPIRGDDMFDLSETLRPQIATSLLDPQRYGDIYKAVLNLVS
jgi:8-oxo-dGTP pyrophosphatase MutT (NUDIX family)